MKHLYMLALLPLLLIHCGDERAPDGERRDAPATRTISVAAAADLKFALHEVIDLFMKTHPDIAVKPSYGSSGSYFAQLSNGAPFDIFLSADIEYPRKLVANGLAVPGSEFRYAIGRVVVWAPGGSGVDVKKFGMLSLTQPGIRKVAIANPEHAPYGRAAESAMRHYRVYDQVKNRLVLGENISQTMQFVESGAADVGIIALSLAMAPAMQGKGDYWVVPAEAHPNIEQGGVIMSSTKEREAARLFVAFLTSVKGREILARYGFTL